VSKNKTLLRLIGIFFVIFLLLKVDIDKMVDVLVGVTPMLLGLGILMNIPQILIKALRWRWLLGKQQISYGIWQVILTYFGSIFVGLVTPGRLGEFVKAIHLYQDCDVPIGTAFSSVLADRLFDLYALLIVGGAALFSLTRWDVGGIWGIVLFAFILTLLLVLFLHPSFLEFAQKIEMRLGRVSGWLISPLKWLRDLGDGLRKISLSSLVILGGITFLAYLVFFGQCYVLLLALGSKISFIQAGFAVGLGSLVTLLPISISGIGTRDVTIVTYLGMMGVSTDVALGYSLLVFLTFYVAGGLMGAIAFWMKPLRLDNLNISKYISK